MRIRLMATVMLLVTGGVCAAEDKPKVHTVDKDPKAVVISLDSRGGMIKRMNDEPVLQVLADGTVKAGNPWSQGKGIEGKLSAEEMQRLLRFILDEEKLGEIKAEDLRMKGGAVVMDGTETTLSVDADGEKKELAGGAVEQVAQQAGADSAAARFVAITKRLYRLREITLLGGNEGMKKILEAANGKLKKDFPAEGEVTEEDLLRAGAVANVSAKAVFDRKVVAADGTWHRLSVTVTVPAKGEIMVDVKTGGLQAK